MPDLVVLTPEMERDISPVIVEVGALAIIDHAGFERASFLAQDVKANIKRVEAHFEPTKRKLHEAHREFCAAVDLLINPLRTLIPIIDERRSDWDRKERARIARAEAGAREAAMKADEDRRLASAAALEAEGRNDEAEIALAAPASIPVVPIASTIKVKGTSSREVHRARLLDLKRLCVEIGSGRAPETLVEFAQGAADRFASSTGGTVPVVGVEFYKETKFSDSATRRSTPA